MERSEIELLPIMKYRELLFRASNLAGIDAGTGFELMMPDEKDNEIKEHLKWFREQGLLN